MHGTHSPRKTHDMGIDGYSFMVHDPIQVKQSSGVGRNVVDNFETAIERAGKNKGYIVAFSFTRGAYKEAARARAEKNLDIELIPVSELAHPTVVEAPTQLFPTPEIEVNPLPAPMPAKAKPSVEELINSDLEE